MSTTAVFVLESAQPAFPFEIMEKILIDMDDIPETLRECALVNSFFRAVAQKRIFSTVELVHYDQYSPHPPHNQIKFLDVLNFAPHLALHVRSLQIRYVQTSQRHDVWDWTAVSNEVNEPSDNVISSILPLLTNVRSISLIADTYHRWGTLCPNVRSALISSFHSSSITHLQLGNIDGIPLFTTLAGCKSLEGLSLFGSVTDATWGLPPSNVELLHQQKSCLKYLEVREIPSFDSFVRHLLDPFTSPVNVMHLESLAIQARPGEGDTGILQLIDASHRTLKYLALYQGNRYCGFPISAPTPLTHIPHLQRLDVRFILMKPLDPPSRSWLSDLLETIPPTSELKELNLTINILRLPVEAVSESDLRDWMSWADFAFDPASKQVNGLDLVQLVIPRSEEDLAQKLSRVFEGDKQLEPLRQKGALRVSLAGI